MGYAGLLAGLILPWLLGVVWLRVRWLKPVETNWPTLLGYGYLAGALATTIVMRLLDLTGAKLSFGSVGLTLCVLIAAGVWAGNGTPLRFRDLGAEWRPLANWQKVAFGGLLAIILIRMAGLGMELIWRPLFPWDAWSQWATKSRVWFELGHLVQFVSNDVWLAGTVPAAYTDPAPNYPPAISLLQVWTCYSLGRWDDALMNLPWLQCAAALGLAFYGQARSWKVPPLPALLCTYFLLSLPILDAHVALAGYADLFMGAIYGMAAMAFFQWTKSRDRWQGAVAILFGLGCAFIKQPGILWILTFVPAVMVARMPRAGLIGAGALAIAGVLVLIVLGEVGNFYLFGYPVRLHYVSVWGPLAQNLLMLDNWHLYWYLVAAALLVSLPRLLDSRMRALTVLVAGAFAFLLVVFFFTAVNAWAEDFTTVNRAFLHMSPMLLFYVLVLIYEGTESRRLRGLSNDQVSSRIRDSKHIERAELSTT
ncbi:hypothetical protein BH11PSE11_BH11PSE11_02200 [soil metagenome]